MRSVRVRSHRRHGGIHVRGHLRQISTHNRIAGHEVDEQAGVELEIFIDNDGRLYEQMTKPIQKNLANKMANGQYDRVLAEKAFMNLADEGAKRYAKEHASSPSEWHTIFDTATRRWVARRFAEEFETEYKLGNYDSYLTKAAQKRRAMRH